MSFVASCVLLSQWPLPSTGVTRPPRYYEPLRHPIRPGLSLASCQLIDTTITAGASRVASRSEEHTSELQSLRHLVCRLLLEKKNCNRVGTGACPRSTSHCNGHLKPSSG